MKGEGKNAPLWWFVTSSHIFCRTFASLWQLLNPAMEDYTQKILISGNRFTYIYITSTLRGLQSQFLNFQ